MGIFSTIQACPLVHILKLFDFKLSVTITLVPSVSGAPVSSSHCFSAAVADLYPQQFVLSEMSSVLSHKSCSRRVCNTNHATGESVTQIMQQKSLSHKSCNRRVCHTNHAAEESVTQIMQQKKVHCHYIAFKGLR